jgi:phospholipid/cholesterol/gamma-HCH transport system substrate-binding protein
LFTFAFPHFVKAGMLNKTGMKVSNETKVGALTAVAITVLILGFNFLKGKNLTKTSDTLYAVFPDVEGLAVASPVYANGLQIGRITDLEAHDEKLSGILVTLTLSESIRIPTTSYATMSKSLLGSASIKIILGSGEKIIQDGDTIRVQMTPDLLEDVKNAVTPAMEKINKTLGSLEEVIHKLDATIDPRMQNNLQSMIQNLNASSASLRNLLDPQQGKLAQTLENTRSITANIAGNNSTIDSSLNNIKELTHKIAALDLEQTIASIKQTLDQLEKTLSNVNNKEGTIGALLQERNLYEEIRQTNRSLNTLLDDLKTNPKRYVSISVFGKKDKSTPLAKPLYDTLSVKGNQ